MSTFEVVVIVWLVANIGFLLGWTLRGWLS